MDMPIDARDIAYAENCLASGDLETAAPLLEQLAQAAGEYAERELQATDQKQWFCFDNAFERLAYRRVERDPRELEQVEVPLDRLYADLAFVHIRRQEWEDARDALMQAVRWNPMNCNYRLDLAELFRVLGDSQEWAALSASVLERAADARSAGCAYANLASFFLEAGNPRAAAGCQRLATRLAANEQRVVRLGARMEQEHPELADEPDDALFAEVNLQGVSTSPNAEIAICLLMCASDAAAAGDRDEAARLTVRARDLVGAEACEALVKLIRESDAELAQERAGSADPAADDALAASGEV